MPAHVRKEGPLSAAELAWINRLPHDPSKVSHEEARVLAGISKTIGRTQNPGDALLVDHAWKPVKEFHDANSAQVNLTRAKAGAPPIPDTAFGALADAILNETKELTVDEAHSRASALLKEVREATGQTTAMEVQRAEAAAMAIDARTYSRTAVTL